MDKTILAWLLLLPLITFTAQYLFTLFNISVRGKKASPPGPIPLPILGNFLTLRNKRTTYFGNLAETYGPLMSFRLGSTKVFVASTSSLAKEIYQNHELTIGQRPRVDVVRLLNHIDLSIIFSPLSSEWRTKRKICNSHIFSSGRLDASKEIRMKKVEELVSYVRACSEGQTPVDIGHAAFSVALNFLSNTMFSIDLADPSSDACQEFRSLVSEMAMETGKLNLADYFPVLKLLDLQGIRRRMSINFRKMKGLINGIIDQRLAEKEGARETSTIPADMLDALLEFSLVNKEFNRSCIVHLLIDLLLAGTDTTSSTVEWAMAELLRNPEKLTRAQQELDQVIGKGNLVDEADIARLPYLRAVVKETLRLHPAAPVNAREVGDCGIDVGGYNIPRGSLLWINILAVGRDPEVWTRPDSFEPERFLDNDIDVRDKEFAFIPFGAGRRICPGIPLVMRTVPTMLSCLIHLFDWKLEDPAELIDMEDKFGMSLQKVQPLRALPIIR